MNPIDTRRWEERRLAQEASFLMPLLAKGMCVVDVECGPGSITRDIAAWVASGWVIGVDTNAERLATAQRLVRQSRLQNVYLQVGEASRLALREETADLVFAHGLIEHLSAHTVAVEVFSRAVKPGGWVALRSPDWGSLLLERPVRPCSRLSTCAIVGSATTRAILKPVENSKVFLITRVWQRSPLVPKPFMKPLQRFEITCARSFGILPSMRSQLVMVGRVKPISRT